MEQAEGHARSSDEITSNMVCNGRTRSSRLFECWSVPIVLIVGQVVGEIAIILIMTGSMLKIASFKIKLDET
jgi:hypothetical protein